MNYIYYWYYWLLLVTDSCLQVNLNIYLSAILCTDEMVIQILNNWLCTWFYSLIFNKLLNWKYTILLSQQRKETELEIELEITK